MHMIISLSITICMNPPPLPRWTSWPPSGSTSGCSGQAANKNDKQLRT